MTDDLKKFSHRMQPIYSTRLKDTSQSTYFISKENEVGPPISPNDFI